MGITVQSMFLNKFKKLTRQLDFFVFIMYLFTGYLTAHYKCSIYGTWWCQDLGSHSSLTLTRPGGTKQTNVMLGSTQYSIISRARTL